MTNKIMKTSLEQHHEVQTRATDVTVGYCGRLPVYQKQQRGPEGRDMRFVVCR